MAVAQQVHQRLRGHFVEVAGEHHDIESRAPARGPPRPLALRRTAVYRRQRPATRIRERRPRGSSGSAPATSMRIWDAAAASSRSDGREAQRLGSSARSSASAIGTRAATQHSQVRGDARRRAGARMCPGSSSRGIPRPSDRRVARAREGVPAKAPTTIGRASTPQLVRRARPNCARRASARGRCSSRPPTTRAARASPISIARSARRSPRAVRQSEALGIDDERDIRRCRARRGQRSVSAPPPIFAGTGASQCGAVRRSPRRQGHHAVTIAQGGHRGTPLRSCGGGYCGGCSP